jgi:hypothetical protein
MPSLLLYNRVRFQRRYRRNLATVAALAAESAVLAVCLFVCLFVRPTFPHFPLATSITLSR